ncbi:MAG: hypothetical protein HY052_08965 [Proteobacteria bacterium]|nr:hypothetical protein [Pseudomonadota bacterium]
MSKTPPPLTPPDAAAPLTIGQAATRILGNWLDGNGVKAQQVRLLRHNTVVHQLPGAVRAELKPEMTKKAFKGQPPHGEVLDSEAAVLSRSDALIDDFLGGQSAVRHEILQAIQNTPGRGFGMEPLTLSLHTAQKEFSVVEKCLKCAGVSFFSCTRCQAMGSIACMTCHEQGFVACQACSGTGRIQQTDGNTSSCLRCQGSGKMQCVSCRGQRQMVCPTCQGQCKISCQECDQSGFITHAYQILYRAECRFEMDRMSCPASVLEAIDKLGTKQLAAEGHADIVWQPAEIRNRQLYISCIVRLPIAEVEFSVEGKSCPARVAGLQGRIVQIDPVLDALIKPGINALLRLSKGPLASQALIETACKYKIIRQAIGGLTRHPKKVVYQKLIRNYPLILSEKYANATVRYADIALLTIGTSPRNKGLLAGTVVAALLAAGYYLTPLRRAILMVMLQYSIGRHILLLDFLICLLGWAAAVFIIKSMALRAFRRLLPESIQTDKRGLPSAGIQGLWALLSTFAVWITTAIIAAKPEWLVMLMKNLNISI